MIDPMLPLPTVTVCERYSAPCCSMAVRASILLLALIVAHAVQVKRRQVPPVPQSIVTPEPTGIDFPGFGTRANERWESSPEGRLSGLTARLNMAATHDLDQTQATRVEYQLNLADSAVCCVSPPSAQSNPALISQVLDCIEPIIRNRSPRLLTHNRPIAEPVLLDGKVRFIDGPVQPQDVTTEDLVATQ